MCDIGSLIAMEGALWIATEGALWIATETDPYNSGTSRDTLS
jgi:hypothetical protein